MLVKDPSTEPSTSRLLLNCPPHLLPNIAPSRSPEAKNLGSTAIGKLTSETHQKKNNYNENTASLSLLVLNFYKSLFIVGYKLAQEIEIRYSWASKCNSSGWWSRKASSALSEFVVRGAGWGGPLLEAWTDKPKGSSLPPSSLVAPRCCWHPHTVPAATSLDESTQAAPELWQQLPRGPLPALLPPVHFQLLKSERLFGIANAKLFTSQRDRVQSWPQAKLPSTHNLSLWNPPPSFLDNICFLIVYFQSRSPSQTSPHPRGKLPPQPPCGASPGELRVDCWERLALYSAGKPRWEKIYFMYFLKWAAALWNEILLHEQLNTSFVSLLL